VGSLVGWWSTDKGAVVVVWGRGAQSDRRVRSRDRRAARREQGELQREEMSAQAVVGLVSREGRSSWVGVVVLVVVASRSRSVVVQQKWVGWSVGWEGVSEWCEGRRPRRGQAAGAGSGNGNGSGSGSGSRAPSAAGGFPSLGLASFVRGFDRGVTRRLRSPSLSSSSSSAVAVATLNAEHRQGAKSTIRNKQ
jgi:hypothetical protein